MPLSSLRSSRSPNDTAGAARRLGSLTPCL